MRDPERARRAQSGILLALAVGPSACLVIWLCLRGYELATGLESPVDPWILAGSLGLVAMLTSARWGQR